MKGKLFDIFVLVFGQSDDARRKNSYFLHASEMHSNTLTSRINPMSDGQAIAYDTGMNVASNNYKIYLINFYNVSAGEALGGLEWKVEDCIIPPPPLFQFIFFFLIFN